MKRKVSIIMDGAELPNELKANVIKALNEDMRRNTSPIKKELDTLIFEAQKRSIREFGSQYE